MLFKQFRININMPSTHSVCAKALFSPGIKQTSYVSTPENISPVNETFHFIFAQTQSEQKIWAECERNFPQRILRRPCRKTISATSLCLVVCAFTRRCAKYVDAECVRCTRNALCFVNLSRPQRSD